MSPLCPFFSGLPFPHFAPRSDKVHKGDADRSCSILAFCGFSFSVLEARAQVLVPCSHGPAWRCFCTPPWCAGVSTKYDSHLTSFLSLEHFLFFTFSCSFPLFPGFPFPVSPFRCPFSSPPSRLVLVTILVLLFLGLFAASVHSRTRFFLLLLHVSLASTPRHLAKTRASPSVPRNGDQRAREHTTRDLLLLPRPHRYTHLFSALFFSAFVSPFSPFGPLLFLCLPPSKGTTASRDLPVVHTTSHSNLRTRAATTSAVLTPTHH